MTRLATSLLLLTSLITVGPAFGQLTDTAPHVPPDYNGFQPPAGGQSYTDPVFGTSIKRLSDAVTSPNNADGGNLTWVMNEYSTMSAFNADRSRFILQHDSYYGLYDGAGNHLGDLPWEVHASSEPRWSRSSQNVLFYINGNRLKRLDVASGAVSVVRTFGEYGSISGHGESDIGFGGDVLVLAGDSRYVFVYTIATNTKSAVLDTGSHDFNSLYLTPDLNVLVSYYPTGTSRWSGIELYDSNMVFRRQVARVGGHMDVTRDADGSEVLVWTNSADPSPICENGIVKVKLSNGHQSCVKSLDWSLAVHVSCPDSGGWCIVSTYAPSEPDPGIGWPAYTNEVVKMKLDGTQVERLAHHRSRRSNGYNYSPRATISRDGSRLVFASNFNLHQLLGRPAEYSDAYLIQLAGGGAPAPAPPTGGGGTGGGGGGTLPAPPAPSPPSTSGRLEEDSPAATYVGSWFPNVSGVHSGGAAKMAMDPGSKVRVTFQGTGIRWIGYRDAWSGIARVRIDGQLRGAVDTYSATDRSQQVLFSVDGLPDGQHVLEVIATGNAGGQSSGAWVWVDAFEVIGTGGGTGGGGGIKLSSGSGAPGGARTTVVRRFPGPVPVR